MITLTVNGQTHTSRCRAGHAAALRAAQRSRAQRRQIRLRHDAMRRLHGAGQRRGESSCVTPVGSIEGNEVTTLEGLGTLDKPHPLQKAFIDEQAAQCGYCIQRHDHAAAGLLNRNPQPQEADVRAALADNLCRCGTHNRIIAPSARVQ